MIEEKTKVTNDLDQRRDGEGVTEFTMRRIRNEIIEECAQEAERLHQKPGWSPHYKNASLAIAGSIRNLKK
jgi:hypothetical protein